MSKPKTNNFRDLQTSFETRSKPTTSTSPESAPRRRSAVERTTNMSSDKSPKAVPAVPQSIDSVLDTPVAKQPNRPLAKLRPSWIGPPRTERAVMSGASTMKQHVIIEYSSPGLKPPVYIFTSLSDPQWDAVEMRAEVQNGAECRFLKEFDVERGEYQYKFRLGPGDWWACDESKATVDDGQGNKNNLLVVKSEQHKPAQLKPESVSSNSLAPTSAATPLTPPATEPHYIKTTAPEGPHGPTPLLKHETFVPNHGSETQETPEREQMDPMAIEESPSDTESSLLMSHEASTPSKQNRPSSTHENKIGPLVLEDDDDDNALEESTSSPLLRHESLAPSSKEQEHAPLFRHESIAMENNHHEPPASPKSLAKHFKKDGYTFSSPAEADPHDPSLEKFPTDHAGIIERIRRTSVTLAEDETSDEPEVDSPHSQALSDTSISIPSLASVHEADEEEHEEHAVAKHKHHKVHHHHVPTESEDAEFDPKASEPEKIEINETVIIEVIEDRSFLVALLDKVGGKGNAIAIAVGMLTLAAGLATMQFL